MFSYHFCPSQKKKLLLISLNRKPIFYFILKIKRKKKKNDVVLFRTHSKISLTRLKPKPRFWKKNPQINVTYISSPLCKQKLEKQKAQINDVSDQKKPKTILFPVSPVRTRIRHPYSAASEIYNSIQVRLKILELHSHQPWFHQHTLEPS